MGADRAAPKRVPELPGFSGAAKFREAGGQVSADCRAAGFDAVVGVPAPLIPRIDAMAYPDTDEMLWLGGRWWWFPGRQISAESQFEWKNGRAYLLEPDGRAVEGILF